MIEEKQDLGRLSDHFDNKRALSIGVYRSVKEKTACEEQLKELKSLGDTFGIEMIVSLSVPIKRFDAATFIGRGKVEELSQIILNQNIGIVVFDDEISPQQQRNLEKQLQCVVIDRTELILGVFARHAKTRESKLQIELAQCRYQLPRLKRLWTHLSRQRVGGASGGYLKGVGERQIELDKRQLKNRIATLQDKIEEIRKHREVQRSKRERTNIPIFAIIGYTNTGKSTLLNALTKADVLVEDKLFATLDTTTRKFTLANNQSILLIDTVGFIRKIPHTLVASFKSTLEEVNFADILLHIIDISNPYAEEQAEASLKVLEELNITNKPIITVLNKIDKCDDNLLIIKMKIKYPKVVIISALKREGFDDLLKMIMQEISLLRKVVKLKIPQSHYGIVALLLKEGRIIFQDYEDNYILVEAEIPNNLESKVEQFVQS